MNVLTKIQQKIYDFIHGELSRDQPAPTAREVAARFKYRSYRAAEDHIAALIRKGWLASTPGKARSLRLVKLAETMSHAVFKIPFLGSIPAGAADDREEEGECVVVAIESVGFTPTRNTIALRVSGNSMIGKHICDGDIVLLDQRAEPRSGQVVAALIDRKSTLKTLVTKNGKTYLKAENPKYPDLIPMEELVIQGVFRALIRKSKD
jgi:repressor LexA